MIFSKLIGLRYCLYFFGTSTVLATLYTCLDLIEKVARYNNTCIGGIPLYIGTIFIPNFIALSHIGCLLGSILLLREWVIQDQFLTMAIHGISRAQFSGIIFAYSFITAGSIFVLHETVGHLNSQKIPAIKSLIFKKKTQSGTWARINTTTFTMSSKQITYIIETNKNPIIKIIPANPDQDHYKGTAFDFQKETLSIFIPIKIDKEQLHPLTYSSTEESLIKIMGQKFTLQNQRIASDLFIFFLKLVFLPFFIVTFFQIAIQQTFMRWIYAGIPYIALGIGSGCMQLFNPLVSSIIFTTITVLLAVFWLKK